LEWFIFLPSLAVAGGSDSLGVGRFFSLVVARRRDGLVVGFGVFDRAAAGATLLSLVAAGDSDSLVVRVSSSLAGCGGSNSSSSFCGGGGDFDSLVVGRFFLGCGATARRFGCWIWSCFLWLRRSFSGGGGREGDSLVVGRFFFWRDGEPFWLFDMAATGATAGQSGCCVWRLLAVAAQQLSHCLSFLSSAPRRGGIRMFDVSSFLAAGAASDSLVVGCLFFFGCGCGGTVWLIGGSLTCNRYVTSSTLFCIFLLSIVLTLSFLSLSFACSFSIACFDLITFCFASRFVHAILLFNNNSTTLLNKNFLNLKLLYSIP
jgi:hypothetical protein